MTQFNPQGAGCPQESNVSIETTGAPVLVTTKNRGVFFGYTDDAPTSTVVTLRSARCAIRFGTTGGFMQLAQTGPTSKSKIGSRAPAITLQDVTSVSAVSEEAVKAWEAAQ